MSVPATRVLAILALVGVIGLVIAVSPAGAQSTITFVDTNIDSDTTWTAEDGPYRVIGNVMVASNATLTIRPGTTVEFAEGVSIAVAGDFLANGTETSPVRLIASRPDSTPGSWGSIRTVGSNSPNVSLAHTEVVDATHGISVRNPDSTVTVSGSAFTSLSESGIEVERADDRTDLAVRESRFQDVGSGIAAVRTDDPPLKAASGWSITDSTFEGVGETGVRVEATRLTRLTVRANRFDGIEGAAMHFGAEQLRATTIRSNVVTASDRAMVVETADVSELSILGNEFVVDRTAVDVRLERNISALAIENNHIEGGETGVAIEHDPQRDGFFSFDLSVTENEIRGQTGSGLSLATSTFSDSELSIRNNTIAENGRFGVRMAVDSFQNAVVADNRIAENGRSGLTMTARYVRNTDVLRNVVRENGASGIEITARLAMGRVAVTENELLDNAREGLAIRSGARTDSSYVIWENVVAANAYGIALSGRQTGNLTKNAVVFNTVAFGDLERRDDAEPGVGILVTAGATDIELDRNDIYGNRVGLQTVIDGTVSAAGNYWGAESGPFHRSIIPEGQGNAVVTEQGWVELVEVRSDPVGERYTRPTAALEIAPQPGYPGQKVTITAAPSEAPNGAITSCRFTIDGRMTVGNSPRRTVTYREIGSYPVSLWVEDNMGIESAEPATALVRIEPEPTTEEPTTFRTTVSTTVPPMTQPDAGGPGLLGWIGGGLGAVLYGIALLLAARGLYETFTEKPLTVRGQRIQVLAFVAILVWAVASVPGPTILGTVAAVGLVAWVTLTGVAFALVKLR